MALGLAELEDELVDSYDLHQNNLIVRYDK